IIMDSLTVYLSGQGSRAMPLYEQIFGNACDVIARSIDPTANWQVLLIRTCIQPVGFDDDQTLRRQEPRAFSGYWLLREYFAFPERFMYAEFGGLGPALEKCEQTAFELVILFDRYDVELENRVTVEDFALNCVPVINLFPKRADRIHLSRQREYHVVVDRTR